MDMRSGVSTRAIRRSALSVVSMVRSGTLTTAAGGFLGAGVGQRVGGLVVQAGLGHVLEHQVAMGEHADGRRRQHRQRQVLLELVQRDVGHLAIALQVADIDDAGAAVGGGFLEPVAAVQAVAARLAAQGQVGFAGFHLGPGRDVFGQQRRADHQRNGDDPQHAQQAHAADAGHAGSPVRCAAPVRPAPGWRRSAGRWAAGRTGGWEGPAPACRAAPSS